MLEGTLDSFTLPDVFQLLAFTKKSGVLNLHHEEDSGEVYFREGQVTYAVATTGRQALGRRLVGAGLVDTETLARALDEQKKSREDGKGLRLGEVLVEHGVLDEATLETFVREQVQDAVFDLMRWSDGAFVFDAGSGAGPTGDQVRLTVSVENLIMEGSRRLEEWDAVRKKIPSLGAVVAMAPLPGDAGVEVNLKPEEWRLLTLVDGRRTVRDLVDLFGQGEFTTCKVLYGLVGAGLLEIRDPELEGPPSVAALLQQQELLRQLEDDDGELPTPRTEPVTGTGSDRARDEDPAGEPVAGDAAQAEQPQQQAAPEEDDADAEPDRADGDEQPEQPMTQTAADQSGPEDQEEQVPEASTPDAATKDAHEDEQLTTDPSIDEDLVRRLIEGVKGL